MRSYLYLLVCMMGLTGLSSSCRHHSQNDTSITMEESDNSFTMTASFPENKTGRVHRLINSSIAPNGLFASVNDYLDVTTTLQDKTNFAVKASPGIVRIKIDREGNSPAAYERIKAMCSEVKEALK